MLTKKEEKSPLEWGNNETCFIVGVCDLQFCQLKKINVAKAIISVVFYRRLKATVITVAFRQRI